MQLVQLKVLGREEWVLWLNPETVHSVRPQLSSDPVTSEPCCYITCSDGTPEGAVYRVAGELNQVVATLTVEG